MIIIKPTIIKNIFNADQPVEGTVLETGSPTFAKGAEGITPVRSSFRRCSLDSN
jgi:hypothetical protein